MSDCFSKDLISSVGLSDQRFPETKEEADLVEDALVREMQSMSLAEQEIAIFELHGINGKYPEDPALIESKLKEMEIELSKLTTPKDSYELAKSMDSSFVTRYHLAFLRSARFDAKLAAEKIVMHFDVKRQLFGSSEILARDIRQSDLSQKDLECLHEGLIQVCPLPDSAGRGVVCLSPCYERNQADLLHVNRGIFYYGTVALKDEDVQRRGIVWVLLNYENSSGTFEFIQMVYNVEKSLPARIEGGHYCYTDDVLRPFVLGIRAFSSKLDRARMRQHKGTPEEIDFILQTFGIPTHALPGKKDGSWSTTFYREFLERQRLKEERDAIPKPQVAPTTDDSAERTTITVPGRFDVLLGKTGQARDHTGNRRAAHICEMYFDVYERATKFQKTVVAEKILSIVRESGGRFLKRGPDQLWVEADDMAARNKISHLFRYMRCKVQADGEYKSSPEISETTSVVPEVTTSVKRVSPPDSPIEPNPDITRSNQQRRKLESPNQ